MGPVRAGQGRREGGPGQGMIPGIPDDFPLCFSSHSSCILTLHYSSIPGKIAPRGVIESLGGVIESLVGVIESLGGVIGRLGGVMGRLGGVIGRLGGVIVNSCIV